MTEESRKRLVIVAGSVGLSVILAGLAFLLGAWGFDTRRYLQHRKLLENMLAKRPRVEQVVQGLADYGASLIGAPAGQDDLARLARDLAGPRAGEVLEKARRWPRVRVFRTGDMIYFIFFDGEGVMRDFVYVSA
jgi:hypothetical protein